jgi:hypothetical protein
MASHERKILNNLNYNSQNSSKKSSRRLAETSARNADAATGRLRSLSAAIFFIGEFDCRVSAFSTLSSTLFCGKAQTIA